MSLQFFCPRWGSEDVPWDIFLGQVKAAGYDGVEYAIGHSVQPDEIDTLFATAEKHGLALIAQHYDTNTAHFREHFEAYSAWFEKIKGFPWIKINSQTGKDFFTMDQNTSLLALATKYGRKLGIPVVHETHRGKFAFAAHVTEKFLDHIPHLRLTLDVSHWVTVAESFLQDQQPALQQAMSRTDHLHARVGYPEGPQVPDPRAPQWADAVAQHLAWWKAVIASRPDLTITCEFGPHPYMVHDPTTHQPLASQWDCNLYMMQLLKQ